MSPLCRHMGRQRAQSPRHGASVSDAVPQAVRAAPWSRRPFERREPVGGVPAVRWGIRRSGLGEVARTALWTVGQRFSYLDVVFGAVSTSSCIARTSGYLATLRSEPLIRCRPIAWSVAWHGPRVPALRAVTHPGTAPRRRHHSVPATGSAYSRVVTRPWACASWRQGLTF